MKNHNKILITFFMLAIGLLMLTTLAKETSADTIIVAQDGSGDYDKIQDAINNATEGYTIRVYEGTYYENVVVNKAVDLVGNGSEMTTINGGGSGNVVRITADWVNMSGFDIRESGSGSIEGGIRIESDHHHISENTCSNNSHGMYIFSTSHVVITNNTCSSNAHYGIYLSSSDFTSIKNNKCFSNNNDGVRLFKSCYNTLTNNTCTDNANGIHLDSSDHNTLTHNTFVNNENGIRVQNSVFNELFYNTISSNTDGIYLKERSRDNTAHYNEIYHNTDYGINAGSNNRCSIDAAYNWWGDDSGPFHTTENPDGQGDNLTDYVDFVPWIGKAPKADFIVSHYFDTSEAINDTNDRFNNSIIDVFYCDRIIFQQRARNPENDSFSYDWEFRCVKTGYSISAQGDSVSGVVGADFLYEGLDGTVPIKPTDNTEPVDYTATLLVRNGTCVYMKTYTIRVHSFAKYTFTKLVRFGISILDARITIVWRGDQDEVAPQVSYISPEKPVFVFIDKTTSPDPNLNYRGGIGHVYDIRTVGCRLQNGEEGFIRAELWLPFLSSDIEAIGDPVVLQADLRLEYYNETAKRFFVVDGSYTMGENWFSHAVGNIERSGLYTTIVDSVYTGDPDVLPELSVVNIVFSSSPAKNGEVIEITASVKNSGQIHTYWVLVKIYEGNNIIDEGRISKLEARGDIAELQTYLFVSMNNPMQQSENHVIRVTVNENHAINEGTGNFDNNEIQKVLTIESIAMLQIASVTFSPSNPKIGDRVTVFITLNNTGYPSATDVWINVGVDNFYIMESIDVGTVESGESVTIEYTWTAEKGNHTFYIETTCQDGFDFSYGGYDNFGGYDYTVKTISVSADESEGSQSNWLIIGVVVILFCTVGVGLLVKHRRSSRTELSATATISHPLSFRPTPYHPPYPRPPFSHPSSPSPPVKSSTKPIEEVKVHEVKTCPKCKGTIPLYSLERPLKVTCPDCGTSFMFREKPEAGVQKEPQEWEGTARKTAKKIKVYGTKTCPKCKGKISITSNERPLRVVCPDCSCSFILKKK